MAVSSLKSKKSFAWIPPEFTANWKITITSGSTETDVTDEIESFSLSDGVTDVVGSFELILPNPSEEYKNKWGNTDIVKFYCDYAETATTLRFKGVIESYSNRNNMIRIKGRSKSARLFNILVTKEYEDASPDSILRNLVDSYATDFTKNNIENSAKNVTVTWFEKPFWECVQELCDSAGFDCYVDANDDFNFFEVGSKENTSEAMVHEINMFRVRDFYDDATQVRNKIKIYGSEQEGTQIIYTSEDVASQATYGTKEEFFRDDNITTFAQAKQVADDKLSQKKDPPRIGVVEGEILATIQPGQKIYVSSPQEGINPALYDILSYEHIIDYGGELKTTLRLNKEPRTASTVFSDIVQQQTRTSTTPINPLQLKFAFNELFNTDSGSRVDTVIENGVLKLENGQPSGTWTSDTRGADETITQAYLVLNGEKIEGASVQVSNNGGITYSNITQRGSVTFSEAGKALKVKIELDDEDTRIDSFTVQYS